MSPPAPIPERDFERMLKEHGCYGEPKGKEYAAYRKSDGRLVSRYGVYHKAGKAREVKHIYIKNFLLALREIEAMETYREEQTEAARNEDWKESDWHKDQEKRLKDLEELQETTEDKP